MVSKSKQKDIETRTSLLEIIRTCLRVGDVENAKYFGNVSRQLKQRIETHDYSEEDEILNRQDEMTRKFINFPNI